MKFLKVAPFFLVTLFACCFIACEPIDLGECTEFNEDLLLTSSTAVTYIESSKQLVLRITPPNDCMANYYGDCMVQFNYTFDFISCNGTSFGQASQDVVFQPNGSSTWNVSADNIVSLADGDFLVIIDMPKWVIFPVFGFQINTTLSANISGGCDTGNFLYSLSFFDLPDGTETVLLPPNLLGSNNYFVFDGSTFPQSYNTCP